MLLNTFSHNKIVKNQNGGLKVPLFDLQCSNVMFRCQNFIGSQHSTSQHLYPYWPLQHTSEQTKPHSQKATKPQSQKDTRTSLRPLTYELLFQNGSKITVLMDRISHVPPISYGMLGLMYLTHSRFTPVGPEGALITAKTGP